MSDKIILPGVVISKGYEKFESLNLIDIKSQSS